MIINVLSAALMAGCSGVWAKAEAASSGRLKMPARRVDDFDIAVFSEKIFFDHGVIAQLRNIAIKIF